jgi:hypothetical protein
MSLKRTLTKKNDARKVKARGSITSMAYIDERKKISKLTNEAKIKVKQNKMLARSLGQRNLNSLHLEKYSQNLKDTINRINEEGVHFNKGVQTIEFENDDEDHHLHRRILKDMKKFNEKDMKMIRQ